MYFSALLTHNAGVYTFIVNGIEVARAKDGVATRRQMVYPTGSFQIGYHNLPKPIPEERLDICIREVCLAFSQFLAPEGNYSKLYIREEGAEPQCYLNGVRNMGGPVVDSSADVFVSVGVEIQREMEATSTSELTQVLIASGVVMVTIQLEKEGHIYGMSDSKVPTLVRITHDYRNKGVPLVQGEIVAVGEIPITSLHLTK